MRNKKSFLFDEEIEAKKIYETGFKNKAIDYGKMYMVTKYIRQKFNYGEIRLEREVIRFCKKQDPYFNPIKEAKAIKRWIKSALKYNLRKINEIPISKKEIDTLKKIENNKDRKFLFVILIISKALKLGNVKRDKSNLQTSEHNYIHYNNFSDIIRLSKINNVNETGLADILHNYNHLFIFYNAERELIRLNYVDKNPNEIVIINDLDNLIYYYDIFFKEKRNIAHCERCLKEIRKNNNRQKYCKTCAKIVNREQHKMIMRKRRAKNVTN